MSCREGTAHEGTDFTRERSPMTRVVFVAVDRLIKPKLEHVDADNEPAFDHGLERGVQCTVCTAEDDASSLVDLSDHLVQICGSSAAVGSCSSSTFRFVQQPDRWAGLPGELELLEWSDKEAFAAEQVASQAGWADLDGNSADLYLAFCLFATVPCYVMLDLPTSICTCTSLVRVSVSSPCTRQTTFELHSTCAARRKKKRTGAPPSEVPDESE